MYDLFVQRACWCFWGGSGCAVARVGLLCRVLCLQLGGAQRLVARFGWVALWYDEGCARRASCMVYSIILALFLAVGRSRVGGRIVVAK